MKASLAAAAAVLVGSASAGHLHHRHNAHHLFEKRGTDLCTTIYETIYGEMTWHPTPACTDTTSTTTATSTSTSTTTEVAKTHSITTTVTEASCSVPTLVVETCPTPGTYTFAATTVVVTETTTVCGGSTTAVPAGTHTLGGVTTVVETETTVVCPAATTSTLPNGVVTSIIEKVTYVCPSAGTYTISPITTVCATETIVVVPVVTSFTPGTYTRPAVVTTVTETDIVVYCPFAIPTVAPAPPPVKTTVQVAAPPPPPAETTVKVVAQPPPAKTTTTAAPPPAKTTTAAAPPATLGGGDQWAISYTPYTTSGSCKSASQVLVDLQEIKAKGFTTIRVYSTDCDTLPNVGAACKAVGLKLIIGVFIGEVGCDNGNPDVASQIAAIKAWGMWELVELAIVGNEAGNQGFCTPAELKALIVEMKTIISEAGYSVPVSTTDTVNTWQNEAFSGALCEVVDVVACNAHAYFNAETTPSQAGAFVSGQLEIVKSICGKEGYVMESGWPSSCVANGLATCSESDQATAIASLKSALGGSIVFFSYSNDDWKDNGACGCEQHWGCGQLF